MALRNRLSREEASIIKDHFQKLIPRLSSQAYKGSSGKVGVVGGSIEYTGAPFFSAMAALRTGADVATIFCHPDAAIPIKSYSPDIIVYPALKPETADNKPPIPKVLIQQLQQMKALAIGPGLGRDDKILDFAAKIIETLRNDSKPMVIDGDGLYLIASRPKLLSNYSDIILTPNAKEFERLWKSVMKSDPPDLDSCPANLLPEREQLKEVSADMDPYVEDTILLARQFPGCVLVRKGIYDVITDGGARVWINGWKGSDRRVSGQGDLLSGISATLLSWSALSKGSLQSKTLSPLNAAVIASVTVREAARLGFTKHGRSLVTSDILICIGLAFRLFLS